MNKQITYRVILVFSFIFFAGFVNAEDCSTVVECAQQSVEAGEAAQKAVDELRAENAALRKEITTHRQELDSAIANAKASALAEIRGGDSQSLPNNGGNFKTATCPVGSYMIGARFQADKGGPHGIISNIFPICRTI